MCVCVSRVCVWICMPVYVAQSLQRHLTASALTVSPSLPLPPSLPLSLYPTLICSIQTTVVVGVVAPLSVLSHTVSVCLFLYSLIFICIFMRRRSLCSRCHCCCCCCWYFIYFEYICEFLFTLSHSRVVVGFMQSFVATQFKTTCNWRILVSLTFSLSLYLYLSVSFFLLDFIYHN